MKVSFLLLSGQCCMGVHQALRRPPWVVDIVHGCHGRCRHGVWVGHVWADFRVPLIAVLTSPLVPSLICCWVQMTLHLYLPSHARQSLWPNFTKARMTTTLSKLSGTSAGMRWEGTEITSDVTNWDTHLARDGKELRSSPCARGYFILYADQCWLFSWPISGWAWSFL